MKAITRRSLLQSLGALPIVSCLDRFAYAGVLSWADPNPVPSPKSVFVLLEGPWLISEIKKYSMLRALSLGFGHHCDVELWRKGARANPQPLGIESLHLHPAFELILTASNWQCTNSLRQAFETVSSEDKFVWIKKKHGGDAEASRKIFDRAVSLSMPSRVYVGGFLTNGCVDETTKEALHWTKIRPHVTTILEYVPEERQDLSLSVSRRHAGKSILQLRPGDHLVLRMRPSTIPPCGMETDHVKKAFNHMSGYVPDANNKPQVTFTLNTSTDCDTGNYVDGFSAAEMGLSNDTCMGLKPRGSEKSARQSGQVSVRQDFANCAGPTIVMGE